MLELPVVASPSTISLLAFWLGFFFCCHYTISITFTIDKNLHKTHRCCFVVFVVVVVVVLVVVVVVVFALCGWRVDCRLSGQKQRAAAAVKVKVEVCTHTHTHQLIYSMMYIYKSVHAYRHIQGFQPSSVVLLLFLLWRPWVFNFNVFRFVSFFYSQCCCCSCSIQFLFSSWFV